jgi:hypothetical protein
MNLNNWWLNHRRTKYREYSIDHFAAIIYKVYENYKVTSINAVLKYF